MPSTAPAAEALTTEDKLGDAGVLARGGLGQLGVAGAMADDLLGHNGPAQALRHHVLRRVPLLQVGNLQSDERSSQMHLIQPASPLGLASSTQTYLHH